MAQIKIYGLRAYLTANRLQFSDVIHECAVSAFQLPADKRFHRFIPLQPEDFIYPEGRSERYTIVEVSMFEGRSVESKKEFIRQMFQLFKERLAISPIDLEITIFETPRHNWGIRGLPGDELNLSYKIEV